MSYKHISVLQQSEGGKNRMCGMVHAATLSGSPAKDFNTRERQHKKKGERHNTSDKSRKFQHKVEV